MATANRRRNAFDKIKKHVNENHPEVKETANVIDILKDEQVVIDR